MTPYVLQRWCASGEFLGCWPADSSADLAKLARDWMQSMERRGYDVAPFPGGLVACRPGADGRLQPVRMVIVEPQPNALEAAPLPEWMVERVPGGGSAGGRER